MSEVQSSTTEAVTSDEKRPVQIIGVKYMGSIDLLCIVRSNAGNTTVVSHVHQITFTTDPEKGKMVHIDPYFALASKGVELMMILEPHNSIIYDPLPALHDEFVKILTSLILSEQPAPATTA